MKKKYNQSKVRKKLRAEADRLYFNYLIKKNPNCEICGKLAQQVHHFFPKGLYAHLRYNLENGISLCFGHHFAHHHQGNPEIHQTIIEKRGQDWYKNLLKEKRKTPASFQKISYFEDKIKELKDL